MRMRTPIDTELSPIHTLWQNSH